MTPEDFVALALAEPLEAETAKYGYSMRVASGNKNPPGVIALTWITGKDAMNRAMAKHHAVAMRELFGEDFVASVWTSVWRPERINRLWVRCLSCAALEDVSDHHRACSRCKDTLPERPDYW